MFYPQIKPLTPAEFAGPADENGTNSKRLRTQAEVKNFILGIVDRLEERVHGTVVELRDQARKISVHPVSNSLWNLPWGANV